MDDVQKAKMESVKHVWNYVPGEFRERFVSPYEQYADRIGQPFTVVETVPADPDDEESVAMYRIRFEDGEVIEAWGEEVCIEDADA